MKNLFYLFCLITFSFGLSAAENTEALCKDGLDNDSDTMIDCEDADCFKNFDHCKKGQSKENTDQLCSDYVDNDGDGYTDCDDFDCSKNRNVSICTPKYSGGPANSSKGFAGSLKIKKKSVGGEASYESNDFLCSDGIDNDSDGLIDCFDPSCDDNEMVTVCNSSSEVKISSYAHIVQSYKYDQVDQKHYHNSGFDKVRVRMMGNLRNLQNSFFLLSMALEDSPRLSFALFTIPIADDLKFDISSGGGSLTNQFLLSYNKRLLLDGSYEFINPFESSKAIALKLRKNFGKHEVMAFAAGGVGSQLAVGASRRFTDDKSYNYEFGGAIDLALMGYASRYDSDIYDQTLENGLMLILGAKKERREANEEFLAAYEKLRYTFGRFLFSVESYQKKESTFDFSSVSFLGQVGFLVIPKRMLIGADFGQLRSTDFKKNTENLGYFLQRQKDLQKTRIASHFFIYGTNVRASFMGERLDYRGETGKWDLKGVFQLSF